MSGHSKWHSIKFKKSIADARRGKIFTKHARLIQIAARKGGDPETNPALRLALDNAKKDNVPNDNIDRAIKKGTGELKDSAQIEEITYEAIGPGGIAVMITCLTDNKNRTISNIKTILNKNGGNISGSGSVAWQFKRKGEISIETEGQNPEELQLKAIDMGAEDVKEEENILYIYTNADKVNLIKESMERDGIRIKEAKITLIPQNIVKISDKNTAKKILKLMDILDEDEDVSDISSNFDILDNIIE